MGAVSPALAWQSPAVRQDSLDWLLLLSASLRMAHNQKPGQDCVQCTAKHIVAQTFHLPGVVILQQTGMQPMVLEPDTEGGLCSERLRYGATVMRDGATLTPTGVAYRPAAMCMAQSAGERSVCC